MIKLESNLVKVVIAFVVATFILQFINGYTNIFYYNRDSFKKFFYYMWLTPSLVHINWMHWFLNILNFAAVIFLFSNIWSKKKILLLFALSSLFIMVCLYFFSKDIDYYAGMSGVLYSFAIYGVLKGYKEYKVVAVIIFIYILLKIFAHDFVNQLTFVDKMLDDFTIVTDVHIYGVIFGIAFFVLEYIKDNFFNNTYKLYHP